MERVSKSIDRLASVLAKKLKESENYAPLDQILKELSKYFYLFVDSEAETLMVASLGLWKRKTRRSRPCMNEHSLSE